MSYFSNLQNRVAPGVTIPDVDVVIDSCFVKVSSYHEVTQTSTLKEVRCSRAEAMQRRGRAGRVRDGLYIR